MRRWAYDHAQLLDVLRSLQGMVVLCGYEHALYHSALPGWATRSTAARASGGRGTALRREMVWLNPACVQALDQWKGLFDDAA